MACIGLKSIVQDAALILAMFLMMAPILRENAGV